MRVLLLLYLAFIGYPYDLKASRNLVPQHFFIGQINDCIFPAYHPSLTSPNVPFCRQFCNVDDAGHHCNTVP